MIHPVSVYTKILFNRFLLTIIQKLHFFVLIGLYACMQSMEVTTA